MGLYVEKIVGYSIAIVTINYLKGKRQIELLEAAFMPGFYINLVCLKKLNNKGIYWNNEKNILYYGNNMIYACCGYYYSQLIIEYNEPKAEDL